MKTRNVPILKNLQCQTLYCAAYDHGVDSASLRRLARNLNNDNSADIIKTTIVTILGEEYGNDHPEIERIENYIKSEITRTQSAADYILAAIKNSDERFCIDRANEILSKVIGVELRGNYFEIVQDAAEVYGAEVAQQFLVAVSKMKRAKK